MERLTTERTLNLRELEMLAQDKAVEFLNADRMEMIRERLCARVKKVKALDDIYANALVQAIPALHRKRQQLESALAEANGEIRKLEVRLTAEREDLHLEIDRHAKTESQRQALQLRSDYFECSRLTEGDYLKLGRPDGFTWRDDVRMWDRCTQSLSESEEKRQALERQVERLRRILKRDGVPAFNKLGWVSTLRLTERALKESVLNESAPTPAPAKLTIKCPCGFEFTVPFLPAEYHGSLMCPRCADVIQNNIQHGVNCKKEPHVKVGYLHADDDDSPYNVDGCSYCGRCHMAL